MANPQRENGFTAIASEIMDKLYALPISGSEFRILLFVIRKTWGFNKKMDLISLSQFVNAIGLKRANICRTIKELVFKRLLIKENSLYKFNKDYEKWLVAKRLPSSQNDNLLVAKRLHTIDTITIDNNTGEKKMSEIKYQPINDEGEQVVKYDGLKKPISDRGKFDYGKELEKLRTSPKTTDNIAALFFFHRELKFRNWDQYYPYLARTIHTAKLLKGYSGKELDKAIEYCKKKWPEEWTLETCVKWIAEVNK